MLRTVCWQSVLGISLLLLGVQGSIGALVVIDDANDIDNTGLGSGVYAPIGGTDTKSAPGQISALLSWSSDGTQTTGAALDTIGEFLTLLDSVKPAGVGNPVTAVVFGFDAQEPGSGSVDMTDLDITFGASLLEFDVGDILRVFAYNSGGAEADAYIQVNFGIDLRTLSSAAAFAISGTLSGADNGPDDLFLTDLSAIPEPGAFLFGGLVCGVVGLTGLARRQRDSFV